MAEPFVLAYPQRQRALERKYTRLGPALAGVPGPMARTMARLDTERAERGLNPLSDRQTGRALSTALTGEAATPDRDPGFVGSIVNDMRAIANPMNLIRGVASEVAAIPNAGEAIRESLQHARNPWEAVGGIAAAPGVRFAPGTFILENALGGWNAETDTRGTPGVLADHPLFTALDVLPYAGKAAKATKVGKAADAAGRRALPAVLTKTLDDAGELTPNRLGRQTERAATRFNASPIGVGVGNQARNLASLVARRSEQSISNPERFDPVMGGLEREAISLADEGNKLIPNPLRQEEIYDGFTQDRSLIELIDDPKERDWAFRMADLTDRVQAVKADRGELVDIDGEWYLPQRVRGLQRAKTRTDMADMLVQARDRFASPTDVPPAAAWDEAADVLDQAHRIRSTGKGRDLQNLSNQNIRAILGGYIASIETASPHKLSKLRRAMTRGDDALGLPELKSTTIPQWVEFLRRHDITDDQGIAVFNDGDIAAFPQRDAVYDVVDVVRSKGTTAQIGTAAGRLEQAWKSRDYNAVIQILDRLYPQKRFATAGDRAVFNLAKRQVRNARALDSAAAAVDKVRIGNRAVTPKTAATIRKTYEKLRADSAPDRFAPIIEKELQGKARDYVQAMHADDPRLPDMIQEVARHHYGSIPEAEFHALRREAIRTWEGHRATGADPIYVHRVTQAGADRLASPLILDRKVNPSSWHERTFSDPPAIKDLAVSMRHDTWEHVARTASESLVDEIATSFGRSFDDVKNQYMSAADARWRRSGTGTREEHLRHLVNRDWVEFNPSEYVPWTKAKRATTGDAVMVPKGISTGLRKMADPAHEHLASIMATPMKVFRTSVLALSPRWHVYNVLGGYLMTAVRTDPAILRYLGKARRMLRDGDAPDELVLGTGAGSAPAEFARDFRQSYERTYRRAVAGDAAAQQRMAAMGMDFRGGLTIRRLLDEASNVGDKVVQKSYQWNQVVDDMYRAMTYLYGRDKAYRKAARAGGDIAEGLSDEAAAAAGVALVSKVMPDWAKMTPFERTAIKSVVPFYGFARHVLDYAATLPFDHPWRVSVLANIAHAEMEDWKSGWPQAWQSMFFFGKPDEYGRQRSIDTAGFNPFGDVANYARLAGFLTGDDERSLAAITSQMGPILQYGMRLAGVDPMAGSAELYQDTVFDPETGRLVSRSQHQNPLQEAANMFAPQVGFVMSNVMGANEWRELSRTDPAAASRQMMTRFGIPLVPKQVDRYEEMFKGEVARGEAQTDARSEAVRTGDWSILDAYPGLDGQRERLEELEAQGALAQFRPQRKPLPSMNQLFSASFSVG